MTSGIEGMNYPQEAEPVAWLADEDKNDPSATTYDAGVAERWLNKGWKVTPLYAHPAPQPAVPVEGAPYRIWAWEGDGQDGWDNAYATTHHVANDQVEYVRADIALRAQPAPQVKALPIAAEGNTIEEMRENVRQHPRFNDLYRRGDMKLFWMNEGDACAALFSALSGAAQL